MSNVIPLIRAYARRYNLDPNAVMQVARVEGGLRWGAVGDQGSSYGPFQLHSGGALPRGQGASFANSPQGIDYALRRMAQSGARGLTGRAAVDAIVRNFERPANPGAEIAKALGQSVGGGGGVPSSAPPSAPSPSSPFISSLITASQQKTPDYSGALTALAKIRQSGQTPGSSAASTAPSAGGSPPSGGPSLSFLKPFASQFGLTITSTTGGTHVPGSYHYSGRAVDFSGSPQHMAALMSYALAHPGQFVEAFYDPSGRFIKNGKVYRGSIGGHSDHVHLAR